MIRKILHRLGTISLALMLIVLPGTIDASYAPGTDAAVRILFINVGKADAILISTDTRNYLVDTGEKSSAPKLIGALNAMGVTSLDGVFLTHTHSDHIGGMDALAQNVKIGMLYSAEFTELTKKGKNKHEEIASKHGLNLQKLAAGTIIPLDNGVEAEVLGPLVLNQEDDNDNSLVLRLKANGKTVLLTGDMQFAEESTLLQSGADVSANVLKVGNHGNPDATSDQFAKAVSPQIAVITTDTTVDADSANPRVLSALSGAEIYITEDFPIGVLLEIRHDGEIKITAPTVTHESAKLSITEINKEAQTITIQNDGDCSDISGYMIFSQKGGELYVFPSGTVLAPGQTIRLAGEGGTGDFIWQEETKPWNQKKEDTAVLYDRYGNEILRKAK